MWSALRGVNTLLCRRRTLAVDECRNPELENELMRILVTGFGPFPGASSNPSEALVAALMRRRRPAFDDAERRSHIFATEYAAVDRDLPQLMAMKPDIVLMFGLAGRARSVRIETRARNTVSVLFPDAGGYRPLEGVIARKHASSLTACAASRNFLGAVRATRVPVTLSRDAGRYLCNYAYWRALEAAKGTPILVQFVHIPRLRNNARPRRRGKRHAPELKELVTAAETVLIALMAARRRDATAASALSARARRAA